MAKVWNPKVGDVLYRVSADINDEDNKCSVEIDEWVVRTILTRTKGKHTFMGIPVRVATLIERNKFTWIKAKGKTQAYDWAKTIDPLWRKSLPVGTLPLNLYSTKRQALMAEISATNTRMKPGGWHDKLTEDEKKEYDAYDTRILSALKSRLTRLGNQTKAKRPPKGV